MCSSAQCSPWSHWQVASKADPAADKAISQGVQPGVQKVQQQAGPQAQKFTDEQMMPAAQKVLPQRLAAAANGSACSCWGVDRLLWARSCRGCPEAWVWGRTCLPDDLGLPAADARAVSLVPARGLGAVNS